MSKTDRLKEEIAWLKGLCGALTTIDASLIVWLVQNYDEAGRMVIATAACVIVPVGASAWAVNRRIYRCLRALEGL